MKHIYLVSGLVALMVLSGCSGFNANMGASAPKCNDITTESGKVIRNCTS